MLSDTEIEILKDWQFDNRIPTFSAAIREAVRLGLIHGSNIDIGDNFQE
jgi:hypothetical protein